jgi:hypothetical protein
MRNKSLQVGRILWFTPKKTLSNIEIAQRIAENAIEKNNIEEEYKLAAIVTGICDDNHVNLAVFDEKGNNYSCIDVPFIDPYRRKDRYPIEGYYCEPIVWCYDFDDKDGPIKLSK